MIQCTQAHEGHDEERRKVEEEEIATMKKEVKVQNEGGGLEDRHFLTRYMDKVVCQFGL